MGLNGSNLFNDIGVNIDNSKGPIVGISYRLPKCLTKNKDRRTLLQTTYVFDKE